MIEGGRCYEVKKGCWKAAGKTQWEGDDKLIEKYPHVKGCEEEQEKEDFIREGCRGELRRSR